MKRLLKLFEIFLLVVILTNTVASPAKANPGIGDQIHQLTVPISGVNTYCSIGLAFDGRFLYYDRCSDQNIYKIDPISGELKDTFPSGIHEFPNALAFDRTRNGMWIGAQSCNTFGMPIYFWDLDDSSVTQAFSIPNNLTNPATGQSFLRECFADGLAFDANDPTDPSDDELWFSDDVNPNIGVFRPDGAFLRGYDATSIDPSLSRASGLAIGGKFLYIANDGGGDVFRADKATDPLNIVDQFTIGDIRQEDMECDPITFAPKEVMWVRTTPQGGQFPDVITAYEIEPGSCGAGGALVDSDNDGLYDVWETEGVTIDPDGTGPLPSQFIDLPAMHANKDVPDIFVHLDWMFANNHNHKLLPTALKLVVDAFDRRGIRLHVDQGPDSTLDFSTQEKWGGLSRAGSIPEVYELDANGTLSAFNWNGFESLKNRPGGFRDSGRSPIFHYGISAHQLYTINAPLGDPCGPSGLSRDIPASDFIVALGGWFLNDKGKDDCDVSPDSADVGTLAQQAGTFMHELGHNLGLHHGGGDNLNNKPNYLSVMNYSFQMNGLLVSGKILQFDYSDTELPIIDEKYLVEQIGIQGGDRYKDYRTFYSCGDPELKVANANGPVDWNCDQDKTYVGLSSDINGDKFCVGPGPNLVLESIPSEDDIVVENVIKNGPNHICESNPGGDDQRFSSLSGYNDWVNLKYDGGLIGLGQAVVDLPMETPAQEITPFETALIPPFTNPESILYMTENQGTLRRVDQSTGATAAVANLQTNSIRGLSNRPGDSTYIYGIYVVDLVNSGLARINTVTGNTDLLPLFDEPTLGISKPQADAIAISPTAPNVAVIAGFSINSGSPGFLWKVNIETGTVLGPAIPTTSWIWELAYSLDGSALYGVNDQGQLVTVDSDTGNVTLIGDPGLNTFIEGLAFRPGDGKLFAIDGYLHDRLVTLDPANGSLLDMMDSLGVVGPYGLAFIPSSQLNVSKSGNGIGMITSDPAGINCGLSCSYEFNANTDVTLTASAATGSAFTGWSGGGCSGNGTCTVTMTTSQSVTANFVQACVAINTFVSPLAGGSVNINQITDGIFDPPPRCQDDNQYPYGAVIRLTAAPEAGYTFNNWFGDLSGSTSPVDITMVSDQSVTAHFRNGGDTTGVFRPSNGALYLKNSNTTGFADIQINYGVGGDYPVVGDWDGNGTVTIGIYRNGSFYLRNENTIGFADVVFPFGAPGDQPVAGDWDGDGVDTIGVYRNGSFFLRNENSAGAPSAIFSLGIPGDVGMAGDWDGDGLDTTGVFRPSNGALYLKNTNSTGIADIQINYGIAGDKPVTGDWDNDGIDTIGIYRNGSFYLRNSNTIGFADLVFALGIPGDMPIAGNWDGIP